MTRLPLQKQINPDGHYYFATYRNGNNQPVQFLRVSDRGPSNEFPYIVPYDSELFAITLCDRDQDIAAEWTADIWLDGSSAGAGAGTPLILPSGTAFVDGNRSVAITFATPIAVTQNQKIYLELATQNQTIRDPQIILHGRVAR